MPESDVPFDAEALNRVEDDESVDEKTLQWAEDELIDGAGPAEVVAKLAGAGWEAPRADELVEAARKRTRAHRGVRTRQDVVKHLDEKYRRSMSPLRVAAKASVGLIGLVAFFLDLRHSLRTISELKKRRNRP